MMLAETTRTHEYSGTVISFQFHCCGVEILHASLRSLGMIPSGVEQVRIYFERVYLERDKSIQNH